MLGFSPVAGLPLAQVPQTAATTIALVADAGAYTITGQATATHFAFAAAGGAYVVTGQSIVFGGSFKAQSGAYALTGNPVTLRSFLSADAGQYSITGNDAALRTRQPAEVGSYSITGSAISFGTRFGLEVGSYIITGTGTLTPIVMIADGGRYVWTLGDFTLIRTGDDTEQVYGGVGHYLEEVERLKRLQAITRVPPPAVFKPMPPMRRTITPQRPAPAAAQPQIDPAAVARAAALKRQQQETEIILLLAS